LTGPWACLIVSGGTFAQENEFKEGEEMAGKSDLVNSIADSVEGITRKQAVAAFEAIFDAMTEALKAGDTVKVPGFGSFAVSQRDARKGRNPATGEAITIKASKSVRFKVGKELKESVNVKKKGGRKSA
jgi:DNA-binding protein HU-beta